MELEDIIRDDCQTVRINKRAFLLQPSDQDLHCLRSFSCRRTNSIYLINTQYTVNLANIIAYMTYNLNILEINSIFMTGFIPKFTPVKQSQHDLSHRGQTFCNTGKRFRTRCDLVCSSCPSGSISLAFGIFHGKETVKVYAR